MRGGVNKHLDGYTIVEVMVVLAVSGVMFFIAATFIAGKQARTAFTTGSNQFTSDVQSIISQVNAGKYSDISFGCSVVGGTPSISAIGSPQGTGTNPDCVFLGKLIWFSDGGNKSKYAVYSLAGARSGTVLDPSSPGVQVNPVPIITGGGGVDLTSHNDIPQSLQISATATAVSVVDLSGASVNVKGIGIVQSLSDAPAGSYGSGAQTVSLAYTQDPSINPGTVIRLHYAQSATICLTDGTRYAEITLGDSASAGSQLSANLKVVPTC